jgi:hypothetical protein
MTNSIPGFAYHAFLSHRYKSPEVNLHFFELFSSVGEVQFKVDRGTSRISMPRLHRMVRDADAFIGIYPLPGSLESRPDVDELRAASRYFRLELDLALRSGKPSIVFYDDRYRSVLQVPAGMYQYRYDVQEIAGKGGTPTVGRQLQAIKRFSEVVAARMEYEAVTTPTQFGGNDTVGLLLPQVELSGAGGYDASIVSDLVDKIEGRGYKCRTLPPVVDAEFFTTLQKLDWVLADVSAGPDLLPVLAFLHGQFTPLLLLRAIEAGAPSTASALESALFGAFEVGYCEDILVWQDRDELFAGVAERLATIEGPVERLNTLDEAREYFRSAGRRKERVFLSYAGDDLPHVAGLGEELRRRFQDVFDYKTAGAIAPGADWIRALFLSLSKSAIGVICLSEEYLASDTCQHEAAELIAQRDQGKTKVFVINLDGTKPPEYMRYLQYITPAQHAGDAGIVDSIVAEVGPEGAA